MSINMVDARAFCTEISKKMEQNFIESLGDLIKLDLISIHMGDFELYKSPYSMNGDFKLAQKIDIRVKGQQKIENLTDENKALRAQIEVLQETIKGFSKA